MIPVLVDNAAMPYENELPDTLRALCYRNASQVRHNPDFKNDITRLVNGLNHLFDNAQPKILTPSEVVKQILPEPFEWIESKINQPTPVTQYLSGASPYEVMDMSGKQIT